LIFVGAALQLYRFSPCYLRQTRAATVSGAEWTRAGQPMRARGRAFPYYFTIANFKSLSAMLLGQKGVDSFENKNTCCPLSQSENA